MKDLIILAADKSMEFALRGALGRPESLGIRPISFDVLVHPGRDGGVRTSGAQLLRLERSRYSHALAVLDHEGSGSHLDASAEEGLLDRQLAAAWEDLGKAIVIKPELDSWMWGTDHGLAQAIGWRFDTPIRSWVREQGFAFNADSKPVRPKEALEQVFEKCRQQISASLYQAIASKISLTRCTDPAFLRLRAKLQEWFPPHRGNNPLGTDSFSGV
jgi:hypothetical protein